MFAGVSFPGKCDTKAPGSTDAPANDFFCGKRTYTLTVKKFTRHKMGWTADFWDQPIMKVKSREDTITDQISVDEMGLTANKLTWLLKK